MEEENNPKRNLRPSFKKKEIVVAMPELQGEFGMAVNECVAKVLFVGKQQEYYKVGDTILFDRNVGRKITYFEEDYWKIDSELSVICEIETIDGGISS